jgi:GTP 3',8-cyclase / cyclic pyranopterin monophosphate synthase
MIELTDKFNRIHNYLRISLTDRCNLNCIYCNPADFQLIKTPRADILNFDEILRLIKIFIGSFGFNKIRFTGGEPFIRKGILQLFEEVDNLKSVYNFDVGITTNGTLLEDKIEHLKKFGVDKLNISLDSLDADKFKFITGKENFESTMRAIYRAIDLEFKPLKINVVVLKNINDNEIIDFVDFAVNKNLNIRFIEFMPFGNNAWSEDAFISYEEMKNKVKEKYSLEEIPSNNGKVAKDFNIVDHPGKVSFISSISDDFCGSCNRLRITAKGEMKLCLFSNGENEINFKQLLSDGKYSDEEICEIIKDALQFKQEKHPEPEELAALEENNMLTLGG